MVVIGEAFALSRVDGWVKPAEKLRCIFVQDKATDSDPVANYVSGRRISRHPGDPLVAEVIGTLREPPLRDDIDPLCGRSNNPEIQTNVIPAVTA